MVQEVHGQFWGYLEGRVATGSFDSVVPWSYLISSYVPVGAPALGLQPQFMEDLGR